MERVAATAAACHDPFLGEALQEVRNQEEAAHRDPYPCQADLPFLAEGPCLEAGRHDPSYQEVDRPCLAVAHRGIREEELPDLAVGPPFPEEARPFLAVHHDPFLAAAACHVPAEPSVPCQDRPLLWQGRPNLQVPVPWGLQADLVLLARLRRGLQSSAFSCPQRVVCFQL